MDKELINVRIDEIINHVNMATKDLENVSLDEFDEVSILGASRACRGRPWDLRSG